MKNIGIIFLLNFFIVVQVSAQSKKNKKEKFLPPTIQSDEAVSEEKIYMEEVVQDASNCVGCAEKLSPSSISSSSGYKYGYTNDHGQLIIPRIFDNAEYFQDDFAIISIGNYKGTINKYGTIVIPIMYGSINRFEKKYLIAAKGGLYGIITNEGVEVMPFVYESIERSDDNLLVIESKNKKGLYDFVTKKWLIEPKYYSIYSSSNYIYCRYEKEKKTDWYNKTTLAIIDSTYSSIESLDYSSFLVTKNNLVGIVNATNEIQVPIIYDELLTNYYSNNYLIAKKNNKYGIISYDNRVLVDFLYDEIKNEKDVFVVKKNSKLGIIDKLTFKETTPCIYKNIKVINSQRIFVQKDELYGIIKYDGSRVEDFVYDLSLNETSLYYGIIVFKKGSKYGIFDQSYNIISEAIFDEIKPISNHYYDKFYLATKGKEKYVLNNKGKNLANVTEYDNILITKNNKCIVSKNKKFGLLDDTYTTIALPIQYDSISIDTENNCYAFSKGLYYKVTFDAQGKPLLTLMQ